MNTGKNKLSILAVLMAVVMIFTLMPAMEVFADTFKAQFGAQFNPEVNADVGEWPDLTGNAVTFEPGAETTLKLEFDAPVAFGENYAAIDTDFPATGHGEISSFKLDGNEVALGSVFLNNEGIDGGLRLTICNKWNGDIAEQAVDIGTLGEFTTLEVTFKVTDAVGAYKAQLGAQFNPEVNADVGEWPDLTGNAVTFNPGVETTLKLAFDAPVAFGENYAAIDTDFPATGHGEISSFKLDGNEVSLGNLFLNNEGIDGGLRLTICNKWNGDIVEQPVDIGTLGEFSTLEVTFTVTEGTGEVEAPVEVAPPPAEEEISIPPIDLNGTYHAYLGVQSENYTYRNAWDDVSYGENGSEWANTPIGNNFSGLTGWVDDVATKFDGTFTDCEIKGNGTYKVTLNDFDFGNDQSFNLLFVSTDIPKEEGKLTFTNVKVMMGGSTKHTFEEAVISPDAKEHIQINCINIWDSDLKDLFGYAMPKNDVAVEFTVSGFAYDKVEEAAPKTEQTTAPADTSQASTAAPVNTNTNDGLPAWAIVLIVVGAIAVVGAAAFIVLKKVKKK